MSFDNLTLTGISFAILYVGIYYALTGHKQENERNPQQDLFDIPECRC